MSDSLRDQLLGLGFRPAPKVPQQPKAGQPARGHRGGTPSTRDASQKARAGHERQGKPPHAGPQPQRKPSTPARAREMDLAKAYAIRAQREKDERIEAERLKQEQARKRREAKAQLAELVKGKALNADNAEIARHFPYGGKIKRVYVTKDQLGRLNAGELGVLQLDGRYLLVDAALLSEAEAVFAPAVALKIDPESPAGDDPYADPRYQVPDDLVW